MITKGRNKTHKFCPRCGILKPISEFHKANTKYYGLVSRCKECRQETRLLTGGKRYIGLHKKPFPLNGKCEICNIELDKSCYHHWDDDNLNLGIWICNSCDYFVEGMDEIDRNFRKVDIYHKLKKEIEDLPEILIHSGPFSPPDGIHRLFLDDKQTHRWCPRCGKMKSINEFSKKRSRNDGLESWCRACRQTYRIFSRDKIHHIGLSKRPNLGHCELCDYKTHLVYHHWDDNNRSKGIWVCQTNKCHNLAEVVDRLDNGSLLPDKYINLKQGLTMKGE